MTDPAHPMLPASVGLGNDVLWQHVDGQVVLLALNPGRYYALDRVGSRMWEVLLEDSDVGRAQERLSTMFDVDEATLRRDLAELITRLVAADLLHAIS